MAQKGHYGCSPDGKWLYYADNTKNYEIYREPIEGGTPELIKASRSFAGRKIADSDCDAN